MLYGIPTLVRAGTRGYRTAMSSAASIFSAALELSPEERAELASKLLESLDEEPDLTPEQWKASWGAELTRRLETHEAGETELVPGDVVFAEAREKLKKLRG